MGAMTPCPPYHPLMIAWTAYKATDEYANTKKWAVQEQHTEGSLWAAFMAGFFAGCQHSSVTVDEYGRAICDDCRTFLPPRAGPQGDRERRA